MATQPNPIERRRSERVLIRVPLKLRAIGTQTPPSLEEAEAIVVSRYGALLRSPAPLVTGSTVELAHGFSKQVEKFRVIWVGPNQKSGQHDVGVESLTTREDFWGIRFPPRQRP